MLHSQRPPSSDGGRFAIMLLMKAILALCADFANGIFALLIAAWVTGTEIVWWYVPVALMTAMLPDIDAIPELLVRGKVSASSEHQHDHRTFLHYPLITLPLAVGVAVFGGFWGLVVGIALVLHLANDLYGTGWGLALLWPLTSTRYKFFGRRVNRMKYMLLEDGDWEKLSPDERRLRLVVSWSEAELGQYLGRWGVENWIERIYYTPSWTSLIEYGLLLTACLLLAFWMI